MRLLARLQLSIFIAVGTLMCFYGCTSPEQSLVFAAQKGDLAKVRTLLDQGANINFRPSTGYPPLSAACRSGHIEVAKELLTRGADINLKDSSGWTPLMIASYTGKNNIVKLLLKNGADLDRRASGKRAAEWALDSGRVEIIRMLRAEEFRRKQEKSGAP